jgi:hypothetical protein
MELKMLFDDALVAGKKQPASGKGDAAAPVALEAPTEKMVSGIMPCVSAVFLAFFIYSCQKYAVVKCHIFGSLTTTGAGDVCD